MTEAFIASQTAGNMRTRTAAPPPAIEKPLRRSQDGATYTPTHHHCLGWVVEAQCLQQTPNMPSLCRPRSTRRRVQITAHHGQKQRPSMADSPNTQETTPLLHSKQAREGRRYCLRWSHCAELLRGARRERHNQSMGRGSPGQDCPRGSDGNDPRSNTNCPRPNNKIFTQTARKTASTSAALTQSPAREAECQVRSRAPVPSLFARIWQGGSTTTLEARELGQHRRVGVTDASG